MLRRFWRSTEACAADTTTLTPRPWYRRLWFLLYAFVTAGAVAIPTFASAAGPGTFTEIGNGLIWGVTTAAFSLARLCISVTLFAMRALIEFSKYNGYMDSPPVIQGWYLIRDLSNMLFIVALLVIAFATILGLESYEWKKSLGKIIMAAILINFSRLICQVMLDAAQVVTIGFMNAVEATAGGNVINMLHLDQVLKMAGQSSQSATFTQFTNSDDLRVEIFGAAVMGTIFALIAMFSMLAYAIIMAIRIAILWVLMILSPIAFVLGAIPQTQSVAEEYWQEFMKYVAVGPILAFFFWLALASMGAGDINKYVGIPPDYGAVDQTAALELYGPPRTSIGEVTTWENMSAFLISIIFLMVGLERVGKIGTLGGDLTGEVYDFGKNALKVGTGAALARWTVGKVSDTAISAAKGAAYYAPLLGGKKWENRARSLKAGVEGAYYDFARNEELPGGAANPINWAKSLVRGSINNEKRAGDLEEIANIKKELMEKAISTKAFFEFEKGGDQMGYGDVKRTLGAQLEVLQERSDAKTQKIKAEAKEEMYGRPRVQDGKVKRDKEGNAKTLADDIEENKVKAETAEKKLSKVAPTARGKLQIQYQEALKKGDHSEHDTLIGKLMHEEHEAHEIEHEVSSRYSQFVSNAAQKAYEEELEKREKFEEAETQKNEKIASLKKIMTARSTEITDAEASLKSKRNLRQDLADQLASDPQNVALQGQLSGLDAEIVAGEGQLGQLQKGLTKVKDEEKKLVDDILKILKDRKSDIKTSDQLLASLAYDVSSDALDLTNKDVDRVKGEIEKLVASVPKDLEKGTDEEKAAVKVEQRKIQDQIAQKQAELEVLNHEREKHEESKKKNYENAMATLGYTTERNPKTNKPKNEDDLRATITGLKKGQMYTSTSTTFRAMAAEVDDEFAKRTMDRAMRSFQSDISGDRILRPYGIELPSSANTKFTEEMKQEMAALGYKQGVNAVLENARVMVKKRLDGETIKSSEVDLSAALLLKSSEHQNWDDVIGGIWDDAELRKIIGERLGWSDGFKTEEKVGQLQGLLASGFDVDFEVGQKKLNDVLEKANADGEDVSGSYEEIAKKKLGDDFWKKHLDSAKKYATNMQLVSEIKDTAVRAGHPHAGGHAEFVKSTGLIMRMPTSVAERLGRQPLQRMSKAQLGQMSVLSYNDWDYHGVSAGKNEKHMAVMLGQIDGVADIRNMPARNQLDQLARGEYELPKTVDGYIDYGSKLLDRQILERINANRRPDQQKLTATSGEFIEAKRRYAVTELAKSMRVCRGAFRIAAVNNNAELKKNLAQNIKDGNIKLRIAGIGLKKETYETDSELIDELNQQMKNFLKDDLKKQLGREITEADEEFKKAFADLEISKDPKKGPRRRGENQDVTSEDEQVAINDDDDSNPRQ